VQPGRRPHVERCVSWVIESPALQLVEPPLALGLGEARPTPRAEPDHERRAATVVDKQPVFLEPGPEGPIPRHLNLDVAGAFGQGDRVRRPLWLNGAPN
jgi:hypothetical protein